MKIEEIDESDTEEHHEYGSSGNKDIEDNDILTGTRQTFDYDSVSDIILEIFPTCSVAPPVQAEDLNHPLLTNQRLSPMKNAFLIMVVLLVKEVGNSLLKKKECMTFLSLS